jgi:preprotein translocase subunit SecY
MSLITHIKSVFSISTLRDKLLYTFLFVLVYRLGSHIFLPTVDVALLKQELFSGGQKSGLIGLLDIFVGGAFSNVSIFALGIMPYISASIIVQVLSIVLPVLQKMRMEGESGQKRVAQITRYLTIIVATLQSIGYFTYISRYFYSDALLVKVFSVLILVTSTLFVVWLADRITEKGLGNGTSVLIMVGILVRFPQAFYVEFLDKRSSMPLFVLEMLFFFAVVLFCVLLTQAVRKLPVQYAKHMMSSSVAKLDYIPIKLNLTGVMPIIFAQAVMVIPGYFFSNVENNWLQELTNPLSLIYNLTDAVLIILFSYLYSAIVFNPVQISDDLKRMSGVMPGIKPGATTAEYIDGVISRLILPSSLFLALVAIMPYFAKTMGIGDRFAVFFGGTSLLIMVGVLIDIMQQIDSHLLNARYDSLINK